MTEGSRHVACVGGIAHTGDGRILLVRRRNEPGRGRWSVPGGRVEPGESDAQALVREMAEETGLTVEVGALVGTVVRGDFHITDYRCTVVGGTLRAGDDAADARWVDAAEFATLPLVEGLAETLDGWGVLPPRRGSIRQLPS
ncbi:NUDIX hydrolase [Pseudonocardia oroxyli]|uniref:NUDIX hydrolase n=1 Tax=Pseudonocardia oroxyli TaxID=366584 RepID=UPI000B850E29|nr:NUDIX hydrolase [Pseudonocardia oroxyli]